MSRRSVRRCADTESNLSSRPRRGAAAPPVPFGQPGRRDRHAEGVSKARWEPAGRPPDARLGAVRASAHPGMPRVASRPRNHRNRARQRGFCAARMPFACWLAGQASVREITLCGDWRPPYGLKTGAVRPCGSTCRHRTGFRGADTSGFGGGPGCLQYEDRHVDVPAGFLSLLPSANSTTSAPRRGTAPCPCGGNAPQRRPASRRSSRDVRAPESRTWCVPRAWPPRSSRGTPGGWPPPTTR